MSDATLEKAIKTIDEAVSTKGQLLYSQGKWEETSALFTEWISVKIRMGWEKEKA